MQTENVFLQKQRHDLKKLLYRKKADHIPSVYSWMTCCSFDTSQNKWNHYRGEDCMEKFCKDLRNQAIKIINYEKKKGNNTAN